MLTTIFPVQLASSEVKWCSVAPEGNGVICQLILRLQLLCSCPIVHAVVLVLVLVLNFFFKGVYLLYSVTSDGTASDFTTSI